MPTTLRRTWIALLVAILAVLVSGAVIVRRFVAHVVHVGCHGALTVIPPGRLVPELGETSRYHPLDGRDDVVLAYDEGQANPRVVWRQAGGREACQDVPVPWDGSYSPRSLFIQRHEREELYIVRSAGDDAWTPPRAVFRKEPYDSGPVRWRHLPDGQNLSMLVLLVGLGALGVAARRALRATPYASRVHAWRSATLSDNGLVEGEGGISLGTTEGRSRLLAGEVLVDPRALDGQDVYRALPILPWRSLRAGSHDRWRASVARDLRDARSLAVLSTVTTVLALAARLFGA